MVGFVGFIDKEGRAPSCAFVARCVTADRGIAKAGFLQLVFLVEISRTFLRKQVKKGIRQGFSYADVSDVTIYLRGFRLESEESLNSIHPKMASINKIAALIILHCFTRLIALSYYNFVTGSEKIGNSADRGSTVSYSLHRFACS